MRRMFLTCAALVLLIATTARAAEKYDPAALAKTIEPYLDDATLFVAHVDATRVDLAPAVAKLKQMIPKLGAPQDPAAAIAALDKGAQAARKWIDDFVKAGGRDYFAVVSMSGFPAFPVYAVVPLRQGADAQAIIKLLSVGDIPELEVTAQVRGDVILWGRKATLDALRTLKPQPRPELAKAFEAAGDSAAQVLFVPSADTRKVLTEFLPNPPAGPFAGSTEAVTKGIVWTAIGVNLSPDVTFDIVIQSPDVHAAAALAETINKAVAVAKQMLTQAVRTMPNAAALIGDVDVLTKAFTPAVADDRLVIHLDADQSLKITGLVVPAVAKARQQAKQVQSADNIRQIVLTCILYANEHKDAFPPDLEILLTTANLPPESLKNPARPEMEVGYAYLPPTKGAFAPAEQVVVYEAWDKNPPPVVCVGFADGHVETMRYAQFTKALADSKARNNPAP